MWVETFLAQNEGGDSNSTLNMIVSVTYYLELHNAISFFFTIEGKFFSKVEL